MSHGLPGVPEFSANDDDTIDDPEFVKECQARIRDMLVEQNDIEIRKIHISFDINFGLVCRTDFVTPDTEKDAVNRIMLWKLPDGDLGEFVGFDISAPPLE